MKRVSNKIKFKMHINSLSGKVIIIITTFIILCAVSWTIIMFINMSGNAKDIALKDEKIYMKTFLQNANDIQEVCNLAKQTIEQNDSIKDYIKLRQKGEELSSSEKINFYKKELSALETMTTINPYIYQVRLFVNADITEKKPSFYKIRRLSNMDWADTYKYSPWQIDYLDKVFPDSVNKNSHLIGLVSQIKDDNGKLLAILEISTPLENMFSGYFNENNSELCCFVDNNGGIYSSDKNKKIFDKNRKKLFEFTYKLKNKSVFATFSNQSCIVSVSDLPSMNGCFVHIKGIKDTVDSFYMSQIPYLYVMLISTAIFIIIVFFMIRNIFRRFNILTSEVAQIENGENIKLTESGNDEISELGKQINKMVVFLDELNRENTQKQLLVKNAEIKSLQNQINAHFMYNVLETIKMMAEIKSEFEISDAITSLGQMFRYSMKWTSGMVELSEEIHYIQNYLNLLNLRFDYEIYLSLNIPDKYMKLRIPKMSLQPLVENSVYHGIENMAEDTYIYIKAFEENNVVNIEVSDAGAGMSEEKLQELRERINAADGVDESKEHGRALYNVSKRLKMYFGAEYGLQIFSKEGVYTKVLIKIPLDKEKQ